MAKPSPTRQAWEDAFRPACRARRMRFVGETGFVLDEVYLTSVSAQVFREDDDRARITWTVDIKLLATDDILWAAFMPDVVMGPQMRINRRVNGSCQVPHLRLSHASCDIAVGDEPDWDPVLDEFDRVRAEFIATHPTPADFISALERAADGLALSKSLTRKITALIAAGRTTDAARIADDAVARGERGGMSRTVDVLKYLSAYAKGPEAYEAFAASLIPTHDYEIHYESRASSPTGLCREHHPSSIRRVLAEMDGRDPWAIVLSVRPPAVTTADFSTSLYLQAAGTAEAMVIELCRPGGADIGAVSVRSVVGHPHTGPIEPDVEIVLPRGIEAISRHEVFTAQETADMFETFYRTDTIDDGYTLRPVEGYTAHGGHIDLRRC